MEERSRRPFGTMPDGTQVEEITLRSGGLTAGILTYGGAVRTLTVPGRSGAAVDVALGFDSLEDYRRQDKYLGALVGRVANRIGGARFSLGGREYPLAANNGENHIHGGLAGFDRQVWQVEEAGADRLVLSLFSPDGQEGYPGDLSVRVAYTLSPEGLSIAYWARSSRDTLCNLTNHSYFNLAGHDRTDKAMEQLLTIPGRFFNPDDAENIPTGELRPVTGTPMDFRAPKPISRDIGADYEPLKLQGGYDHNWEVFCNPCATLSDPVSGRSMSVCTDCPGIQFYAGNFLNETGKGGVHYGKRSGVALETQFYPDSLHHPDWPQPVTRAGETYRSETVYRFSWDG